MSLDNQTWSQRIASQGLNKDMRDYQSLKESNEMERAGTRRLYEHLKRKHGDAQARQMLKAKGYNLNLL